LGQDFRILKAQSSLRAEFRCTCTIFSLLLF